MGQGKHLGRVRERYRTFSWGVEGCKEVDEERDDTNSRRVALRYQETETGGEKCPR